MMNNEFVMKQARLVSEIIEKQKVHDLNSKIRLAFLKCLGRLPNEEENESIHSFFSKKNLKK